MFGVRRQDAAMFLARHVALSQSADISAQSKYAHRRRPGACPEDEGRTRALPWSHEGLALVARGPCPGRTRALPWSHEGLALV
jgi:hypothetical protein